MSGATGEGVGEGYGDGVNVGVGPGVGVGVGDGVGEGEGVSVGDGPGLGLGVGDCVGVGEGEGEGEEVGVVAGVASGISPSVALLALLNKESEDCGITGIITPDRHRVITTRVPIGCQLRFSFILILSIRFFHKNCFLNLSVQ